MKKGDKKTASKVFSIICTVLTAIIVAVTVAIIVNMIVCRARKKPVSFFGTSFAIVQTQSMEPYIMTGDLILFRSCEYSDVKVGDYVVFVAGEGFGNLQGQSIVHAVIKITDDGLQTQGRNVKTNPEPDPDLVTADNLLGICTYNSAGWGAVFSFITKYGIFIILAVVALPFIVSQTIKIIKYSKEKKLEDVAGGSLVISDSPTEGRALEIDDVPETDVIFKISDLPDNSENIEKTEKEEQPAQRFDSTETEKDDKK